MARNPQRLREPRPVVSRSRVHPSIHPKVDEGLLPGPATYNPKGPPMRGGVKLVAEERRKRVQNPWGVGDVWRHVVVGLDSPGPAYLPPQPEPKQGCLFAGAPRSHIIDNMMRLTRTFAETPGPGAHDPVPADEIRRCASMHPKLTKRTTLTPGPGCYSVDESARLTHRVATRCAIAQASRGELFPQPRPGEGSPGPQQLCVSDSLRGLQDAAGPLKRQLRPVRAASVSGAVASFGRAPRWIPLRASSPGPMYNPSLAAVTVGASTACSIGPDPKQRSLSAQEKWGYTAPPPGRPRRRRQGGKGGGEFSNEPPMHDVAMYDNASQQLDALARLRI